MNILQTVSINEIDVPLKLLGPQTETFLCNGQNILFTQLSGISPVVKILLNTIVKYGTGNSVVHFEKSAGRPSGLGDLFACK